MIDKDLRFVVILAIIFSLFSFYMHHKSIEHSPEYNNIVRDFNK